MTLRRHRRLFVALFAVSWMPAVLGLVGRPAGAQDEDSVPVVPERSAYFTTPVSDALPAVLTSEVPPGVVCIVAGIGGVPQVCGDEIQALKALLVGTPLDVSDGLPLPATPDPELPQPVVPGTVPIGLLAGVERYATLIEFATPPVPENHQVDRYELVLHEAAAGLNVAFESPAFREAVLATISQVGEQSPEPYIELFQHIIAQETDLIGTEATGIEACLVVEDWEEGESQPGNTQPDVDCIFGANGIRDAEAGTWAFDLTFMAQAWVDGTPNLGISFKPLSAENLAYGDPDLSTNFIISLAVPEDGDEVATFSLDVSEIPPPPAPLPLPVFGGEDTSILGNTPVGGSDIFAAPTASFDTPPVPEAAPAPSPAVPVVVGEVVPLSSIDSTWYLWLLLPFGVGMVWSYAGAVDAVPARAAGREGALVRLIETRRGRTL